MPSQNGVRREQSAKLFESLATEDLALNRKTTPLIVVEQNAFPANLFLEYLIFGVEIFDNFLLMAIDPAGDNHQAKLPGLKNERHDLPCW